MQVKSASKVALHPFRELVLANYREMRRDLSGLFLMVGFPFLMFGLVAMVGLGATLRTYTIGLVVPAHATDSTTRIVNALNTDSKLKVQSVTPDSGMEGLRRGDLDAALVLPDDLLTQQITVTVGSGKASAASRLRVSLQKAAGTLKPEQLVVRDMNGLEPVEFWKMMLPFTMFICFWFLSFYSISHQISQLRQRGTLKLLGLTPLPRITFVLAQIPARLALALVQLFLIGLFGYIADFLTLERMPGLLLTTLLGVLMTFSFGYLLGGLIRVPEAALIIPAALMPAIAFPAGFMIPVETMPAWVGTASKFLPFTYMADSIKYFLLGSTAKYPIATSFTVMIATTAAVTLLTAKFFYWGQGEAR